MPTVLYVGAKYDYGDKSRGLSFEHRNFHHSLRSWCERQGWNFVPYDFYTRGQEIGQDAMTQELLDLARTLKPAFLFSVLVDHHLDPHHEVFSQIGQSGETVTLHWFCDDHWRWEKYSQFVAPHFHFVTTTAPSALPKYAQLGLADRVIQTQWACNQEIYTPTETAQDVDVSFVGMPHGDRPAFLNALAGRGVDVQVFGHGWQGRPRLPFHQMVRLFSRSKINLNLSNASMMTGQQIKGRNFEIPGAGGFLLSGPADGLGDYYEDGREIVTFSDVDDLAEKARYYLAHDAERERIARNGYERTLAEHTWPHRFDQIFRAVGQRLAALGSTTDAANTVAPLAIEGARGFNVLSLPEWDSSAHWQALVQAYVEEFGPSDDVALILRPSSTSWQPVEEMAAALDAFIEDALGRDPNRVPDIIFEVSPLSEGDLPRLFRTAQCVITPTGDTEALRRQMRQAWGGERELRQAA